MSKRDIRIGIVAFVTLVTTLVLVSSPRVQAAQLAGEASEGKHCVAHLEPINPDSDASSTVTELGCFSTFEEAISVATDGAVKLSSDVLPSELTEEMLRARGMGTASSSVVIGVDYDDVGFNSWLGTYTWTADQGCTPTLGFAVPSMPSGWDDRVSSARSYSNCYKYYHYEDTNYAGTSITCDMGNTCETMGYMNNRTSSERWRYQ